MGNNERRDDRVRRVRRVRDRWRKDERAARGASTSDPGAANEERRAESLTFLDGIRAEAPESDLETRRAADELEREIERGRKEL
jgi:hypothetical protein